MSSAARKPGPRLITTEVPAITGELPSNLEAERQILGAVMLHNHLLPIAEESLRNDDFYFPQHRPVWDAVLALAEESQPITILTVTETCGRFGSLEAAGGAAYISQLTDGMYQMAPATFRHSVEIIKEKSTLRKIAYASQVLQIRALERGAKVSDCEGCIEEIGRIISQSEAKTPTLQFPDMPDAVLDGRLGEICETRLAGFPIAYSWVSLLAVAAGLVPRMDERRANIYACVIGDVGSGKSHSIQSAIKVLGLSEPILETTLAGSAEGLLKRIGDVAGQSRVLFPDELGHLLTKAKIDHASLPFVLNTAFYKDKFALTIARGGEISFNCSLGIVGGIVEENFEQCFGAATTGGLYDRFLFGACPRPFVYNYRPVEGASEFTDPREVSIAPDVWEARSEWSRTIPDLSPRCAEIAIRAAIIAASFSGRTILAARHLAPARALAEYQARLRNRFKPNPGENSDARCAFAILRALDKAEGWIRKREVAKVIHFERFGPSVFERSIGALEAAGEIRVDKSRPVKVRRLS